jgi:predicted Rossmann fold flavoprotein
MVKKTIVVIGGGAAGMFAAIRCATLAPHAEVVLLEKTRQLLAKVRISGGGRCNVTHAAFDPAQLVKHYPRGNKELLGPFHRFQPRDTVHWFAERGVKLKTEADGRMFPVTDSSETIIECLFREAKSHRVQIRTEQKISSIRKTADGFDICFEDAPPLSCCALLLATGSSPQGHAIARELGHSITPLVPSLFTFNVPTSPLLDLSGISVDDVEISLPGTSFKQRGPLLLTHFGFSGPAALKLSAWAARELHACHYKRDLQIRWVPTHTTEEINVNLLELKKSKPLKYLENESLFSLASNLWKRFIKLSHISERTPLSHLSHQQIQSLCTLLCESRFLIEGKTTNKQEFVTCGGIHLKEVDFKTMESRCTQGLYFAGECLDIDGVTGGFNFQNAWTTGWIAGTAMAQAACI